MWRQLEKPTVVKCSQKFAERFASMEPAPRDRPLQEVRRERLLNIIQAGEFRTCNWASAICKENGTEYRINGKHTSSVLKDLNGDLKHAVWVTVEKYECDTLEDVAKLYATFDARWGMRSVGDINRSFAASNPHLASLPTRLINACASGLSYARWENAMFRHLPDERATLLLEHVEFVVWLGELCKSGKYEDCRAFIRQSVVAAMFRTWGKSKSAATEFWTLVRDASGPRNTSADRCLNKYLNRVAVNTGNGSRVAGPPKADQREVFVKCLHAWNAWRRDLPTDLKYYANAKVPAVS